MILSCTSFINKILCQTNRSDVKLIICNHFYLLMSLLVFRYIHLSAIGDETNNRTKCRLSIRLLTRSISCWCKGLRDISVFLLFCGLYRRSFMQQRVLANSLFHVITKLYLFSPLSNSTVIGSISEGLSVGYQFRCSGTTTNNP